MLAISQNTQTTCLVLLFLNYHNVHTIVEVTMYFVAM